MTSRTRILQSLLVALTLLLAVLVAHPARAVSSPLPPSTPPPEQEQQEEGDQGEEQAGEKQAEEEEEPEFEPYDEVITDEAVTREGVFTTHRVDERLYYEIPESELGREFVWVTQIARTQTSYGYGGLQAQNRVVRWDRRDDKVLLRNMEYDLRADEGTREAIAVEASSVPAIIAAFDIVSFSAEGAPVIDVTRLFTSDVTEFSPQIQLRDVRGIDRDRTFITEVKAFPRNIETRVLATYSRQPANPFQPSQSRIPRPQRSDPSVGSVTVELHHSMVALPDDPMEPRRHDPRVGFFSVGYEDYSSEQHEVENVRYITRWRLEKENPDAAVSDPVEPIVYYVGREIPDKWRPYVAQGIEDWQVAFEAAGFSNAIVAAEPPSEEEDSDWDAEDVRYSTVRWLPSTIQNAFGPHVHDPRTGEILEADIRFYHNVIQLLRDWYFVQVAPLDPRAQDLPLPEDLMGELVRYVTAHEVGHTLGFPHNMKASSCYTVEQLRSAEFTREHGNEASIMDYGRFNYVAQPGDGARLIPIVGPYDEFATEWGYKPIPEADTPEQERPYLNEIAARQLEDRCLLFGSPGSDPLAQTEDLSADAIEATRLGLANIDRIAGFLVTATSEEGEHYDLLDNMYTQMLRQRDRELGHVANQVGGVVVDLKVYGQPADVYRPVPRDRQAAAVGFLLENGFVVPDSLLPQDVLQRIGMNGVVSVFGGSQSRLLSTLYQDRRVQRMIDVEATSSEPVYTVADMTGDLVNGIFSELRESAPTVDAFRRNLQRAFVDLLVERVTRPSAAWTDMRAVARGALTDIRDRAGIAARNAGDTVTRYHLQDLAARIDAALEASYAIEG